MPAASALSISVLKDGAFRAGQVTVWEGEKIVSLARSLTDFHYACSLSELAVDSACQRMGIGKGLIDHTRQALGPHCKLRLISAPAAVDYYPRIGFDRNPQCWELLPGKDLG